MPRATLFSATLGEDGKVEPPLGPLYIAAALENVGWDVDFRDYQLVPNANPYDPNLIYEFLDGHETILLVSCFVDMLPVVIAACELIKASRPDTTIILGGPGPTANAGKFLDVYPWLDGVVMGEGEDTIQEWARSPGTRAASLDTPIPGLAWRKNGVGVEGPERPRIQGGFLRPAYHLLDWKPYSSARIVTTRGCPYRCSFCDVAPLWGRRAVYRDLDDTIDEMLMLRDLYGKSSIAIVDDTFVLNRDRVREFCRLLISRSCRLQWGCFGRINLMSEDLIALMARAGCIGIFYGIDSGSPNVLKRTFKELKAATIYTTLEVSARYFERIEASFIWGYPFETYEDFLLTLDMAGRASHLAPTVNVQMHMLSPLPSSPLYKEFPDALLRPEQADRDWLLLPGLLLDDRAGAVNRIIDSAPHLFPGFFTFPTPDKAKKRDDLGRAIKSLDHTIGMTLFDEDIHSLIRCENRLVESRLLAGAESAEERIGIGLALGFFRRTRVRFQEEASTAAEIVRGPALVRQRNDELAMR
jgi:anaerobic magnesium-protoporphyrin IX monomethyl ester cyclase